MISLETQPSFFITHGGGPMPLMDDPTQKNIKEFLQNIQQKIPSKPSMLIIFSAHWEEQEFTLLDNDEPDLLFDYGGFPHETYNYKYQTKSSSDQRERIANAFKKKGIQLNRNKNRGLDHGVFVPLLLMYPKADIPVVQISLKKGFDPLQHIKVGEALYDLRKEGCVLLGSGSSYHNMQHLMMGHPQIGQISQQFDDALNDIITNKQYSQSQRYQMILQWKKLPQGQLCHPREEHLAPLFVIIGGTSCGLQIFTDTMFGAKMSSYMLE